MPSRKLLHQLLWRNHNTVPDRSRTTTPPSQISPTFCVSVEASDTTAPIRPCRNWARVVTKNHGTCLKPTSRKTRCRLTPSDAVVVGTVSAGRAYLSNDKRNIYSEFQFKIREIIKAPSAVYLQKQDSIDIHRKGGSIRLPSGKILVRGALADSMPLAGKRYLLFLKYDPSTEDYAILTGYELEGNEVYRLNDLSYGESAHQKIIHPLRREGVAEDQFLNRVKSKLSRKDGGS
jgi:hypothetical protein